VIQFYWPGTTGEWLAFSSAAITIGFGLLLLAMPRLSFRVMRIQAVPGHADAIAEGRGTMAGFYLSAGLCCILLAQPLIYLVLGLGWAFTAFGRFMSILFDRGATRFNWISLVIEMLLAVLPLAYVFGYVR
jgi:hypothetical protein